uniref:Zinc finger MYM-type containing 4, tandem duplicate 1 n=1 Tax=Tetraodon nigroviridis TaxID=99883 RepID=H3D187_TETNG
PSTPLVKGQMFCSHCKKALVKGQTAFQRRGSPALFCSTSCLTAFLPAVKRPPTVCQNCCKLIFQPQDIILSPAGKDSLKEFCSQSCLASFNDKNNDATQKPSQSVGPQSLCSVCSRCCISKHDVIMNGTVHKMCSDACFKNFRTAKNLSMACCANCGNYCHNKPMLLQMDGSGQVLCNAECLAKYKQNTKVSQPCMLCQTARMLEDMIDDRNDDDSVNLFCSSSCVMAHKVQTVSASGTRINCDNCGKNRVPAYHLAMSDTSVRNFCTLSCVTAFQKHCLDNILENTQGQNHSRENHRGTVALRPQEKVRNSQKQESFCTMLPIESSQRQTAVPIRPRRDSSKQPQKLNCSQCSCHITSKPEVIQNKGKLVFVCSAKCSEEFKKANSVTSLCESCKMEKITAEAEKINNKDCFFCSDECKVLFRQKLAESWGKHCRSCGYCCSMSEKLVTAMYGGSAEEFCSEDCRSKYTLLFCHVAKCDTCGQKGKLKQTLPVLGDVKHFCDLTCLLQFCCDNSICSSCCADSRQEAQTGSSLGPSGTDQVTSGVADDVSLADSPAQKMITNHDYILISSRLKAVLLKCCGREERVVECAFLPSDDSVRHLTSCACVCVKVLKKKKRLSGKPNNKERPCNLEAESPVSEEVMVIPVPVPVYVPVPMNMYTQCTPRPVGLPLPLPVPMLLPVTMDNAERIVETIQEIKEKIPSDPFEAELIFMAEMVAEDNEKNGKGQTSKNRVEKESEKQEASAPSGEGLKTPVQPVPHEKLSSVSDTTGSVSAEQRSEAPAPGTSPGPPPGPPSLDIEADISVGEKIQRRQQTSRKSREAKTKSRMSQRLSKASEAMSKKECVQKKPAVLELPKLKSEYGIEAWKRWVQWRQTQPDLEKPRYACKSGITGNTVTQIISEQKSNDGIARLMVLKEDVLQCTTAELSYGLCCFISEVKRPNGSPYSPDSLFYLCLGIQQHLFENGRVENIFMDQFYSKFSAEFTCMLKGFKPPVTASGYIHSRVEEEFLWDCKQLGAYSPIVLLNTLLFFCCKYFGFTTVKQHRQLSFAHLMRCVRTNQDFTKTTFLRFYPPSAAKETESGTDVPSKRRKEEESKEEVLEMIENTDNPLRCPVRLFEFYLSKCSESVKQRSNVFYLLPERCCVPNSPLWFSTTSLDDSTIEAMLIRILSVRDLHVRTSESGRRKPSDTSQDIHE